MIISTKSRPVPMLSSLDRNRMKPEPNTLGCMCVEGNVKVQTGLRLKSLFLTVLMGFAGGRGCWWVRRFSV